MAAQESNPRLNVVRRHEVRLVQDDDQRLLQLLRHLVVQRRRDVVQWVANVCDEADDVSRADDPPQLPPHLQRETTAAHINTQA